LNREGAKWRDVPRELNAKNLPPKFWKGGNRQPKAAHTLFLSVLSRLREFAMDVPVEIAFHNIEHSDALEARIRARVGKLEQLFPHITSCRIAVEAPHRSQAKATQYHVRIELHVPGKNFLVSRDPGDMHSHGDVYLALRDSFDAMERQLEDFARRLKNRSHQSARAGRHTDLAPENI
jgi:ribosomal subunit interface protein